MTHNVGKKDKIVRVVIGVAAIVAGIYISPWFYIVAFIALVTSAMSFCPLWKIFGVNTCAVKQEEKKTEATNTEASSEHPEGEEREN